MNHKWESANLVVLLFIGSNCIRHHIVVGVDTITKRSTLLSRSKVIRDNYSTIVDVFNLHQHQRRKAKTWPRAPKITPPNGVPLVEQNFWYAENRIKRQRSPSIWNGSLTSCLSFDLLFILPYTKCVIYNIRVENSCNRDRRKLRF